MNAKKPIVDPHIPYCHQRLLEDISRLCDRFGDILKVVAVGLSEQGREIPVMSLGSGDRRVLATGAIHGREYVTAGFLLRCVEEYASSFVQGENYGIYDVRALFRKFTLHILPVANPDSVETALGRETPSVHTENFDSKLFKNNANNVNLNANFPYAWECVPECRQGGTHPASERETRFLMELCKGWNYEKMLSFHSRGDCIFWRDRGNGVIDGDRALACILKQRSGFSLCNPTESAENYSGGFENWFRSEFRRPALCVELVHDDTAPFDLCCAQFEYFARWEQTRYALLAALC